MKNNKNGLNDIEIAFSKIDNVNVIESLFDTNFKKNITNNTYSIPLILLMLPLLLTIIV